MHALPGLGLEQPQRARNDDLTLILAAALADELVVPAGDVLPPARDRRLRSASEARVRTSHRALRLKYGIVTSSFFFSKTTSTGMSIVIASFAQPTIRACIRGPSSSSTITTL